MMKPKLLNEAAKKTSKLSEKVLNKPEKTAEAAPGDNHSTSPKTQAVEETERDLKNVTIEVVPTFETWGRLDKPVDRREIEYVLH